MGTYVAEVIFVHWCIWSQVTILLAFFSGPKKKESETYDRYNRGHYRQRERQRKSQYLRLNEESVGGVGKKFREIQSPLHLDIIVRLWHLSSASPYTWHHEGPMETPGSVYTAERNTEASPDVV